eukprot:gene1930-2734_t
MIRLALPGFTNNWLVLVKATALVSLLGLQDIMFRARGAAEATGKPFTFYLLAGGFYLAITVLSLGALVWVGRRIEPMSWDVIVDHFARFLDGARLTLLLTLIALGIAFALSIVLALLRNSPRWWLRHLIGAYTLVFRGTPLLIQLFLIYYGLAQFEIVRQSFVWPWLSSPLICVLIAFVLNTTAYTTEIF